jgi:uncharacterized iron-regulated membrane protein
MIKALHKTLGLICAPFFILTALTGLVLLWRKSGMYGKETKDLLLGLHNWELAASYVGAILAAALILMVLTGLAMARRGKGDNKK